MVGRRRRDHRVRHGGRGAVRAACRFGVLTGGATAICGASAAIAIASVLPRDEKSERELVFTVAGVTALSTLAMILYPAIAGMAGPRCARRPACSSAAPSTTSRRWSALATASRPRSATPRCSPRCCASRCCCRSSWRCRSSCATVQRERIAQRRSAAAAVSARVRRARRRREPRPDPEAVGAALNEIARACLVVAIAAVGLKTSLVEMKKVGARAIVLLGSKRSSSQPSCLLPRSSPEKETACRDDRRGPPALTAADRPDHPVSLAGCHASRPLPATVWGTPGRDDMPYLIVPLLFHSVRGRAALSAAQGKESARFELLVNAVISSLAIAIWLSLVRPQRRRVWRSVREGWGHFGGSEQFLRKKVFVQKIDGTLAGICRKQTPHPLRPRRGGRGRPSAGTPQLGRS